jgi:outer membrane murein-binding lipoprotein Lpp
VDNIEYRINIIKENQKTSQILYDHLRLGSNTQQLWTGLYKDGPGYESHEMADTTLYDTIVGISALVAILTPAASVIYYFGVSRTKIDRLISDVQDLHEKIYNVSVKLDAYLLARGLLAREEHDKTRGEIN